MARRKSRSGLSQQPLFLILTGIAAAAMAPPAILASATDDDKAGQAFLYASALGLFIVAMIAIARGKSSGAPTQMRQLLALFAAFAGLPVYLALPFQHALQTTSYMNAYVTMVSAVTTTGLDLYQDPTRLTPALHLQSMIYAILHLARDPSTRRAMSTTIRTTSSGASLRQSKSDSYTANLRRAKPSLRSSWHAA